MEKKETKVPEGHAKMHAVRATFGPHMVWLAAGHEEKDGIQPLQLTNPWHWSKN